MVVDNIGANMQSSSSLSCAVDKAVKNEDNFITEVEHLLKLCEHPAVERGSTTLENFTKNVKDILKVHTNLRDTLQKSPTVTPAFSGFVPSLTLYLDYCCYQKRARHSFEELMNSDSEMRQHLEKLLVAPVHHLTRYEAILTNLCKILPEQDGKIMNGICEAVQRTVSGMKNICTTTENALKILWIQKCFVGGQPKIFVPGRILLREGSLMKVNQNCRGVQERILFLFNDILVVCKGKRSQKHRYKPSSLHCCSVIPLHNCSVRSALTSKAEGEPVFKVSWDNNTYLLFSKTVGLSQSWAREIQMAIRNYKDTVSLMQGSDRSVKNRTLRRTAAIVRKPLISKQSSETDVKQQLLSVQDDSLSQPQRAQTGLFSIQSLKSLFNIRVKRLS